MALRTVKLDKTAEVPPEMRRTHGRFERWRKSHRGRLRIPDALLRAAAQLVDEYEVFRTAKVLRLGHTKLKWVIAGAGKSLAIVS